MKTRIMICGLAMALVSGCALLETGAKATFDIAWDAATTVVKNKLPILKEEILDGAKAMADEALDKAMVYAGEKTESAAEKAFVAALRPLEVNAWDFDMDNNGVLSEAEQFQALTAAKQSEDQPWYAPMLLALATLAFTGGKSIKRWLAGKREEEMVAVAEGVVDAEA